MTLCKPAAIATTLLLTVGACQSGVEPTSTLTTVPIQIAYRDSQCMKERAIIEPIHNITVLMDWWQPLARQQIPAKQLPQSLRAINFERSAVFVLSMGSQPTAGYGIELHSDRATVQRESLTIPAGWQEPPADTMVAQVVTSPCIVFTVPANRYQTVMVRDRQGNTLVETRF